MQLPFNIRSAGAAIVLIASVSPALAQTAQSRAELLRQAREEKQSTVRPYVPNTFEKTMRVIEEHGIPLIGREGVGLKLGSLTTGSGFAYGVGLRNSRVADRRGILTAWAAASLKNYWAMEARLQLPELAAGRLFAESYARRHEYPQEDYFGLGPDARRGDHTTFRLHSNAVGARLGVRPTRPVLIGGGVEYLTPRVGAGASDALPSIGEVFDDVTASGLLSRPEYIRSSVFLEVDYREPRNARKGGWYRTDVSRFEDRGGGDYTFTRLDVDVRQYVSFLNERRVVAARLFLSTSDLARGRRIPFYLMPTLGGHDSLRGFRDYRFRGPHALLLQGEYRWEIWSGFDAALFYDAGKVALRRADLGLAGLARNYGVGFRFNTDNGVIMRVDTGFGSPDGTHLFIVFGGVF
jgi:hypothetical protein